MNPVAPNRRHPAALLLPALVLSIAWSAVAEPASQVRLLAARTIVATATLETIEQRGLDEARRAQCKTLAGEALQAISAVKVDPASRDDVLQLSRAVKGLLVWIEDKLTTASEGTPLLDERAAAVARCVEVARKFADGADAEYTARLQSWSVDALSLSIEKSETVEVRELRDLAEEWKARLDEVEFEPDRDDDLTRSVRTASERILAYPSWARAVSTDPARLVADSVLRTSLLRAALRAGPKLDDLRRRLAEGARAAAASDQGVVASACMLWDLLQLAKVIRSEQPELWESSESQLWRLLLGGHYHQLTAEARPIDQSSTKPRLSDWDRSDPTGGSGTEIEFEAGGVDGFRVSVLANGNESLTLPDGSSLGWTGSSWAVPGHPHWIKVADRNGTELDVVARWEGTPGPVVLPLPVKVPASMVLLYGFGKDAPATRLLACSTTNWKRSRLARVLLAAREDAHEAAAEILATDVDEVRKNQDEEINTIEGSTKDDRLFELSEVAAFHPDLNAIDSVFRLPPATLPGTEDLGWTQVRLGWSGGEFRLVTDSLPTDEAARYVVRNFIEIAVEESSR